MTFCDLCCKDAAADEKSVNCEDCARWWVKNNADQPQGLKYQYIAGDAHNAGEE